MSHELPGSALYMLLVQTMGALSTVLTVVVLTGMFGSAESNVADVHPTLTRRVQPNVTRRYTC